MTVRTFTHRIRTRGEGDIKNLTDEVVSCIRKAGVSEGTATLFVPGSTAGITTIEFEPGVIRDIQDCLDRLAPRDIPYAHEKAWHDGNGHSHVRAGILGPSLVLPVQGGGPGVGTWQQVVLIDFDNKPRERAWTITVMGE